MAPILSTPRTATIISAERGTKSATVRTGADASRAQAPRHGVRALIELAVGEARLARDQRECVRMAGDLALPQLDDRRRRRVGSLGSVPDVDLRARFVVGDQRERFHARRRIGDDAAQKHAELLGHPLRRLRVEQILGVSSEPISRSPISATRSVEVELGDPARQRVALERERVPLHAVAEGAERDRAERAHRFVARLLQREHRLKERRSAGISRAASSRSTSSGKGTS